MGYRSLNSINVGSGYKGNTPPANGALIEGSVAIGNTSAAEKLDVAGNIVLDNTIFLEGAAGTNRQIQFNTVTTPRWALRVNSTAESGSNVGSDLAIHSFNDAGNDLINPAMFVRRSNGNVGIGTNNPLGLLHLESASPTIRLVDTDNTNSFSTINLSSGADTTLGISCTASTGTADIAISPLPQIGTEEALFRLFPFTNTTGNVLFQVYPGNGGGPISAQLSGNSVNDSFTCINGGDFGVGTSSPPSRLSVYENTTNTGATAGITIEQDGTGDAVCHFVLSATEDWTCGIDNSDADAFKICNSTTMGSSTTDHMVIDQAGEVTFQNTTNFLAYRSGDVADVTGDGTDYTILYNAEVLDNNNDFDTSTGIFTAPVTGSHKLIGSVNLLQVGASHTFGQFQLVTSNRTYISYSNPANIRNSSNYVFLTLTVLTDMDAADTATCHVIISNSTKTIDIDGSSAATTLFTYFIGNLEC